jgi:hypothetical protein
MTSSKTEKLLLLSLIQQVRNTDDKARRYELADSLCDTLERLVVVEDERSTESNFTPFLEAAE